MFTFLTTRERGVTLVIGSPEQQILLTAVATLALRGPVQVIVGGNRFDAHQLARLVRRQTVAVDAVLERVMLARPFTCYQMVTRLTETVVTAPLIIPDFLDTFYDESINDAEAVRLVKTAVSYLRRLGEQQPVLLTVRPPPTPQRAGLIKMVRGIARRVYVQERPLRRTQGQLLTDLQPPLL